MVSFKKWMYFTVLTILNCFFIFKKLNFIYLKLKQFINNKLKMEISKFDLQMKYLAPNGVTLNNDEQMNIGLALH